MYMVLIHSFDSVCHQTIVAVEDAKQFAANGGDSRFQSRHVTFIGYVAYQTDTVGGEEPIDYIEGVVGRAVINNYEFPIFICL
jgi:hypothetical protein